MSFSGFVRWYLRFPISFTHMAEMALERGLLIPFGEKNWICMNSMILQDEYPGSPHAFAM